jgi:glycosyltransferase involved in cell wall biosynthesis
MVKKILFFIGTLSSGGKERRLLELLTFFSKNPDYELVLVTKKSEVMFENFFGLDVKWICLKNEKLGMCSFMELFKIVKREKPHIIHSWGNKYTLVSIPSILFQRKIKLVNSEITAAPPKIPIDEKLISLLNFIFSDIILSNSHAGIEVYRPPLRKSKVIYNGLNMDRFLGLPEKEEIKEKFGLDRKYTLVMIASYSENKDHKRFFEVGKELNKLRGDTIFLGAGFFQEGNQKFFDECVEFTKGISNLKPVPGVKNVEALVHACDIGILFSNIKVHGEGISNAVIEYMALGKPVIANDAGGTKEIVRHGENGYLVHEESPEEIAKLIDNLLNDPEKMKQMGVNSKARIEAEFSLERMGDEFEKVYESLLGLRTSQKNDPQ